MADIPLLREWQAVYIAAMTAPDGAVGTKADEAEAAIHQRVQELANSPNNEERLLIEDAIRGLGVLRRSKLK